MIDLHIFREFFIWKIRRDIIRHCLPLSIAEKILPVPVKVILGRPEAFFFRREEGAKKS